MSDHPVGRRADSGEWIPALGSLGRGGLHQGPGGSHPRKGASRCFIGRYQASSWIPEAGWLPKNSGLSLANCRAERSRIHSALERNRTINGLAAAAVRGGPASGKRDLRKAKRPVSLPAAGRNASQGCLSTMPRKKSSYFLAMVVRNPPRLRWRQFFARRRPSSAVGPKRSHAELAGSSIGTTGNDLDPFGHTAPTSRDAAPGRKP